MKHLHALASVCAVSGQRPMAIAQTVARTCHGVRKPFTERVL